MNDIPADLPQQPADCPRCKGPTVCHHSITPDGVILETHHCRCCGDVVPRRKDEEIDWSAA